MILKAAFLCTFLMTMGFLALWTRRKRPASQRRLLCVSTLIACAIAWGFAFAPMTRLPEFRSSAAADFRQAITSRAETKLAQFTDIRASTSKATLPQRQRDFPWAGVYATGGGVTFLFWISGWIYSFCLVRRGKPAFESGTGSKWRSSVVTTVDIPLCLGWPYRSILLPKGAEHWEADKLDAVIKHEAAHLESQDHIWINLASLLCIAQWFNPLSWLLARRLRQECEHSADDSVLRSGVKPSFYAEVILGFQPRNASMNPLCSLQPLMRKSGLTRRMEQILSPTTDRRPMKRVTAIFIATASIAAACICSGFIFVSERAFEPPVSSQIVCKPAKNRFPAYTISRDVEVLQIGIRSGGKSLVWDANGNPVPKDEVIDHPWHADEYYGGLAGSGEVITGPGVFRHIVFRVRAEPSDVDPVVGCETAPDSKLNNGYKEMNTNGAYLQTKGGWHYFMHAVAIVPFSTGGRAKISGAPSIYGVGKAALLASVALTKPIDEGPVGNLPLFSAWKASDYSGKLMGEEDGLTPNKDNNSKVWSKVLFMHPNLYWSTAHFFRKDGSEIPDRLVEGWFVNSGGNGKPLEGGYFIGVPASQIGEVRMTTRKSVYVELYGIPMSPNMSITP